MFLFNSIKFYLKYFFRQKELFKWFSLSAFTLYKIVCLGYVAKRLHITRLYFKGIKKDIQEKTHILHMYYKTFTYTEALFKNHYIKIYILQFFTIY